MEGVCSLFELVNPQMLSHHQRSRLVRSFTDRNPDTMNKDQLLQFVIDQLSPKAQRIYRDNRLGEKLKQKQNSRKRTNNGSKFSLEPAHKIIKSDSSSTSRLKPPPSPPKRTHSENRNGSSNEDSGKRTKITWP